MVHQYKLNGYCIVLDTSSGSVHAVDPVAYDIICLLYTSTTPWTLPSNLGLCVNAKEEYATVAADGVEYILAKALVETHFGEDADIRSTCLGADLVGMEYVPLFRCV